MASDEAVVIDGSEIHDSRWVGLRTAVSEHENGELGMLPPTYITLCDLARYETVAQVLAGEGERVPDEVFPVFGESEGKVVVMFRGDAGYDSGDGAANGAQHRAVFDGNRWEYRHWEVDPAYPSFIKSKTDSKGG